eukprot:768253-Hanusia_phi.AAC.5
MPATLIARILGWGTFHSRGGVKQGGVPVNSTPKGLLGRGARMQSELPVNATGRCRNFRT